MTPATLTQQFLDRYHSEMPHRIHSRDTNESGGPEWSQGFAGYIVDGEERWATTNSDDLIKCDHPSLRCSPKCDRNHRHVERAGTCPTCLDSGYRQRFRRRYRRPMKRALASIARIPVPAGRPRYDVVLRALANHDGNLGLASQELAKEYVCMASPEFAKAWTLTALIKCSKEYRAEDPGREIRGRSESQLVAEAA